MAKKRKPNPGVCVHCCKTVDDRNKDHVFPKAWYPETTPPGIERWTVDSCFPCNRAHGRNEEGLLLRIGICLSPGDIASAGIAEKALRSIQPEYATNDRDRRARAALREKLRKEMIVSDE